MEKTINLSALNDKSRISFFSKDGSINFLKPSTHVLVYWDDAINPNIDMFAELHILENNQPQIGVFELSIPKNTDRAKIVISSNIHDIDLMDAKEF